MNLKGPATFALLIGMLTYFPIEADAEPVNTVLAVPGLITVTYVLDSQQADVTGDGLLDRIELIGHKRQPEDLFADHLQLVIQDGSSEQKKIIDLDDLAGYQARLFVGDFTGDSVADILISAPTGGSGGIVDHRVVTFVKGTPEIVFGKRHNQGVHFTGQYLDGLKAELVNEETNRPIVLDISTNQDAYYTSGLYNKEKKVLKQVNPYAIPFSKLEPVDQDHDGVYELQGYQRVIGAYNADTLCIVRSLWKYENSSWKLKELTLSTDLLKLQENPTTLTF